METNKIKISSFGAFNELRYSAPWVARLVATKYRFDVDSVYTGVARKGEAGDLILIDPIEGQIYAYGQKDRRGNRTELKYALFEDGKFIELTREEAMTRS